METIRRLNDPESKMCIERERQEPLTRIAALVVDDGAGRIYCQRRALTVRHHPGTWTVTAGGHQEPKDEGNDEATLRRECWEEIQLAIPEETKKSVDFYFPGNATTPASTLQFYEATVPGLAINQEQMDATCIQEMGWLTPEKLLADPYGLQPEFRQFLEIREKLKRAPFAIIWDMDDTLFDSRRVLFRVFRQRLHQLTGQTVSDSLLYQYHGKTFPEYASFLSQELGQPIDAQDLRLAIEEMEELQHEELDVRPLSGLLQLFESLDTHGIPSIVGTSSPSGRARRILDRLGLRKHMLGVVGADDVQRHKPFPDTFLTGAARLGIAPERCIVIEDSLGGWQAAKGAGMAFLALDAGFHQDADLRTADRVTELYEHVSVDQLSQLVQENIHRQHERNR